MRIEETHCIPNPIAHCTKTLGLNKLKKINVLMQYVTHWQGLIIADENRPLILSQCLIK